MISLRLVSWRVPSMLLTIQHVASRKAAVKFSDWQLCSPTEAPTTVLRAARVVGALLNAVGFTLVSRVYSSFAVRVCSQRAMPGCWGECLRHVRAKKGPGCYQRLVPRHACVPEKCPNWLICGSWGTPTGLDREGGRCEDCELSFGQDLLIRASAGSELCRNCACEVALLVKLPGSHCKHWVCVRCCRGIYPFDLADPPDLDPASLITQDANAVDQSSNNEFTSEDSDDDQQEEEDEEDDDDDSEEYFRKLMEAERKSDEKDKRMMEKWKRRESRPPNYRMEECPFCFQRRAHQEESVDEDEGSDDDDGDDSEDLDRQHCVWR
jgi:hypothetical protein